MHTLSTVPTWIPRACGVWLPFCRFEISSLLAEHGKIERLETSLSGAARSRHAASVSSAAAASRGAAGRCTAQFANRKQAEAALTALSGRELHGHALEAAFLAEEWIYAAAEGTPMLPAQVEEQLASAGGEAAAGAGPASSPSAQREYLTPAERAERSRTSAQREEAREGERARMAVARLEAREAAVRARLEAMSEEDRQRARMAALAADDEAQDGGLLA